ncbi:DUF3263 domain-containing protein [Herbidospora sp. NBRC 101105]|uniref:DUF3263 domain-containing protein n=1 Tax=Herbidospora sp. NBRC 101105 TaxID=3032195 RepID=UPI00255635E2|nr:DUF3263 domain-containing protein [Herbidospora sp. NBRC 101105]
MATVNIARVDGLSPQDRDILAFEAGWWRHPGAKEQAIKDTFGMSTTRYYQVLAGLIDRPEAVAADPALVNRLRERRDARRRGRGRSV